MAHADAWLVKDPEVLVQNPKRQVPPLAAEEERFVIQASDLINFASSGAGSFGEVVGFELGLAVVCPTPRVTPFTNAQGSGLLVADLVGEDVNIRTPGETVCYFFRL